MASQGLEFVAASILAICEAPLLVTGNTFETKQTPLTQVLLSAEAMLPLGFEGCLSKGANPVIRIVAEECANTKQKETAKAMIAIGCQEVSACLKTSTPWVLSVVANVIAMWTAFRRVYGTPAGPFSFAAARV